MLIDKIPFIENSRHSLCYDFMIGPYKVQEKVGVVVKNRKNSIVYVLHKCNGRNKNKIAYAVGDNDLYWLHIPNTEEFFVIPESVMLEKKHVGPDAKFHLVYNEQRAWMNTYKYNYTEGAVNQLQVLLAGL